MCYDALYIMYIMFPYNKVAHWHEYFTFFSSPLHHNYHEHMSEYLTAKY